MAASTVPANNLEFVKTCNLFSEFLSVYYPNLKDISYNEWVQAASDHKAALLYVKFYQEVTLAWYNAVTSKNVVFISQEDGVSTVLQYLMKNVAQISDDSDRFTAEYVYTVCYNCLFSLWRSRKGEQTRSSNEVSPEFTVDMPGTVFGYTVKVGAHIDLFNLAPSEDLDIETQQTLEAMWNVVHHMGPKAEKVVNHLINPKDTLHRVSKSSPERPIDRLADVTVTELEYQEILAELREKLRPYKDAICMF